jgi:hypothetical protein
MFANKIANIIQEKTLFLFAKTTKNNDLRRFFAFAMQRSGVQLPSAPLYLKMTKGVVTAKNWTTFLDDSLDGLGFPMVQQKTQKPSPGHPGLFHFWTPNLGWLPK